MISDSDRSEGRRLLAKATKGPWRQGFADGSGMTSITAPETRRGAQMDERTVIRGRQDGWGVPQGVEEPEDAALIVWLRNHATELLRDHRLADAFHDVRVEAAGVAAYKVELAEKVRAQFATLRHEHVRHPMQGGDATDAYIGSALADTETAILRLIEDPAPSEGGEG